MDALVGNSHNYTTTMEAMKFSAVHRYWILKDAAGTSIPGHHELAESLLKYSTVLDWKMVAVCVDA